MYLYYYVISFIYKYYSIISHTNHNVKDNNWNYKYINFFAFHCKHNYTCIFYTFKSTDDIKRIAYALLINII